MTQDEQHFSIRTPTWLPDADAGTLTIHGSVTRGSATPIAQARVTLADQTGRQLGRAVTAEDGSYTLGLAHGGTFLLTVAAEGVAPEAQLVPVTDTSVRQDFILAGAGRLHGRVLQDVREGREPGGADALVTLTDITGHVVGSQRTDRNGTYVFDDLGAGDYVVTVQSGTHRPCARAVSLTGVEAQELDVVLAAGGTLEGQVIGATDRSPVWDATVTLSDASGQLVGAAVTGEDGRYHFSDLVRGSYVLTAAGYAPVTQRVEVVDGEVSEYSLTLGQDRHRTRSERPGSPS